MTNTQQIELLTKLVKLQETCSNIELSIGGVSDSGMVEHDTIIIKQCPPIVVKTLTEYGYMLSVTNKGMRVEILN